MDKQDEVKTERITIYVIAGCICFLFLLLTTCTIHMNSYNPNEAKAEAIKQNAKIEVSKQAHQETMERLKIVEKLIKNENVGPVAARCAVEGWNQKTSDVCLAVVKEWK